jgi:uncharacterized protein
MANIVLNDIQVPEQQAPKIEFPCDYPIRIMGESSTEFLQTVLAIVEQHAKIPDRESIRMRDSSKGRFVSAHVIIEATCAEQLHELHLALREYKAVKMVL